MNVSRRGGRRSGLGRSTTWSSCGTVPTARGRCSAAAERVAELRTRRACTPPVRRWVRARQRQPAGPTQGRVRPVMVGAQAQVVNRRKGSGDRSAHGSAAWSTMSKRHQHRRVVPWDCAMEAGVTSSACAPMLEGQPR